MGLFKNAVIDAIYDEALDAGLAAKRMVLFSGFDPSVQASVMADAAGQPQATVLRLDLSKLNSLTEPIADGSFVLTIWLEAAAQDLLPVAPIRAQKFSDWAAVLQARPSLRSDPEGAVKEIVEARNDQITSPPAVDELAGELEGYIDLLAPHADVLVRSKRLHDALHSLQTGALPMLRQISALGVGNPMFAPLANSTLTMFETTATGITADIATLNGAAAVVTLAQALAIALNANAQAARVAARNGDEASYRNAITALRSRIKDDMSSLETEIDQRIGSMQPGQPLSLDQLLAALEKLAAQATDPTLKTAAASAVQSLTVIRIDLAMIGRRHHDWQTLDSQLWVLEAVFDQLAEGKDLGIIFQTMWDDIVRKLKALADTPPPTWADRIAELVTKFVADCPQPPAVPLAASAPEGFAAVVGEIRNVFREVDLNLKASCEGLGAITAQLTKL